MGDRKSKEKEKEKSKKLEKSKYTILAVVSIIILLGSFVLFYQIQKQQSPSSSTGNQELAKQIEDLNKKIEGLNGELEKAKSESPVVETQSFSSSSSSSSSSSGKVAGETSERSGTVNINTASSSQLDSLPGIGPAYAQRIIDYRNANGGFKTIEEVKNVKGIGDKTFDKFKDQITI